MELIKRYVYAVGKKLQKKHREDILKELTSSIYDSLEDRYGKKEEYSKSEVSTILSDLGSPSKVASAYQKSNTYLIGPSLINTYLLVIKIVSLAVSIGLFISFIIGLFRPSLTVADYFLGILELIPAILMGIISAIGFVTVIFYLIERYVPDYQLKDLHKDDVFNPDSLPKVPDEKNRISVVESIVGIIFTIIAIVLFNLFANKLGIYYFNGVENNWHFIEIFSKEAIKTYLPFWNIAWFFSLVFQIFCLIQGEWNLKIRLFDIFNNILTIGIFILMINGPEIVDLNTLLVRAGDDVSNALNPIASLINYSLDPIFIFALVVSIIALIVKIVQFFLHLAEKTS